MLKLFSKTKSVNPVFSQVNTDMHSHLIPGIDDGSPDIQTSLQLIKGMSELGFKKLITTPHVMWDMYKNTRDVILEKADELQKEILASGLDVELVAAAEYFLDDHVSGLLSRKEKLLSFGENYVLVEFSLAHPPLDPKEQLFDMQLAGYQPIIAHPERYSYLQGNKEFYDELKDAGYFFQANILSFGNYYGRNITELANYLAKKNYYDFVGTDLHNARYLEALLQSSIVSPLQRLIDQGGIRNKEL